MRESVRQRYERLVRAGEIVPDPMQARLADALDALVVALDARQPRNAGRNPLTRLLFRRNDTAAPRGLYIWGDVGRGKTLLMDLFFATVAASRKRRVHFHQFMGEVHDRVAAARAAARGRGQDADPITSVANALADELELLCFDEFAVYDIADAMILGRLFEQMFRRGLTLVATSNVAPDDLYKDGLNRALFVPFIALLKQRTIVFHLDAPRDYRLDAGGTVRRYVTPLGPEAEACLDAHFRHFANGARVEPTEIAAKGRRIKVPEAANGVARFTFSDLCGKPLGAGDYLRIAERYPTIVLSDVPVLQAARRNEAKRLINLIDTLYDKGVRLIVSAEAEPDELWQGKDGAETFEFQRTASRLIEMRSDAYWDAATTRADAEKKRPRR